MGMCSMAYFEPNSPSQRALRHVSVFDVEAYKAQPACACVCLTGCD